MHYTVPTMKLYLCSKADISDGTLILRRTNLLAKEVTTFYPNPKFFFLYSNFFKGKLQKHGKNAKKVTKLIHHT